MVISEKCDTNNVTTERKEISIKILCGFPIDPSLDNFKDLLLTQEDVAGTGNELLEVYGIKIAFSICKVWGDWGSFPLFPVL